MNAATAAPEQPTQTAPAGLAHVATASFLAARISPAAAFWLALAGGVALARASQRHGARQGYGVALGSMLETIAIMGPARLNGPLTQAMTAPMLGRLEARGTAPWKQAAACGGIRMLHNTALTAIFIWVILGGLDAYEGTFDLVERIVPAFSGGTVAVLVATGLGLFVWAIFASIVQVIVYRRGLHGWSDAEPPGAHAPAALAPDTVAEDASEPARSPRFDPRAIVLAAAVAFAVLLLGVTWPVLAAVTAWLVISSLLTGLDRDPVIAGLILAGLLGGGVLVFGLLGGLGADLAVRRAARAVLLVLVATWLRAAARADGVREVSRRVLHRLRRVPSATEAARVLDELGSGRRLLEAGRRLIDRLVPVPKRIIPVVDAVLSWVTVEAARYPGVVRRAALALRLRARDLALVVLAVLLVGALV